MHNRDKQETCRQRATRAQWAWRPAAAASRCAADRALTKRGRLGPCSVAEWGSGERAHGVRGIHGRVLDFVRLHREWAAPIVFVLAFGESLAFVSLILPFWAMLVGIGTIIGAADTLIFWTIVSAAAIGAALGDWLSYWLGYHYHEQIQAHVAAQPLSQADRRRPQVLHAMGRVGRSCSAASPGPLRASVPIVAGITQMPQLSFQIANWSSAFLWAFVLLSPGTFGMKWWLEHFS